MLSTGSNIIQALQYKHFDKRMVIYTLISSLLPSVFLNSYSSDFKLSLPSSTPKRLRMDTAVSLQHPPLRSLLPKERLSVFVCLFCPIWIETALHLLCRSFSPDVTAAILVYKTMKTAAMLVYRKTSVGDWHFCNVKNVFVPTNLHSCLPREWKRSIVTWKKFESVGCYGYEI